jgi:UDP-N-acetylglucosamine--N-acetylmuramyl-(pentapeptide) pyrophosphoryl-undecaprenol N-acetylglucosamine transferase
MNLRGAPMGSILVAAAGTGGHVLPGLAVARELRDRGWRVAWIGTRSGREREWVQAEGFDFEAVRFSSVRGKGLARLLLGPARVLVATWQCWRIARRRAADVLFTTGGYIAVPAGLGARLAGARLAFLNADAAPQLSLRLLRVLVARVLCGFDGAALRLAGARGLVSGVPVRADICALPPPRERFAAATGPLRLLVLGGSLGARVLNDSVPRALALLAPGARPRVVHQCGAGNEDATRALYRQLGVEAEVEPFLAGMAVRYAGCDVVLCRAGAVTVAELCAAGIASILVPLVAPTTDHQRTNAALLERAGAALVLPQERLGADSLAALLSGLARGRLLDLAVAARGLGRPDATRVVVGEILRMQPGA